MTDNTSLNKRKTKSLIAKNKAVLTDYALRNYAASGRGIIVINLLLLETDRLDKLILDIDGKNDSEPTVHQPISYIPQASFWFKMINLKIKKKYQIDIQAGDDSEDKFLIVFIKDDSIEHFSIYSISIK